MDKNQDELPHLAENMTPDEAAAREAVAYAQAEANMPGNSLISRNPGEPRGIEKVPVAEVADVQSESEAKSGKKPEIVSLAMASEPSVAVLEMPSFRSERNSKSG